MTDDEMRIYFAAHCPHEEVVARAPRAKDMPSALYQRGIIGENECTRGEYTDAHVHTLRAQLRWEYAEEMIAERA